MIDTAGLYAMQVRNAMRSCVEAAGLDAGEVEQVVTVKDLS